MDPASLTLRATTPADLAAVDALLARSFPRLLATHYHPSTIVLAVPRLARANPRLVGSGRHFGLWQGARLLGVAGYSLTPEGSGPVFAEIRQVATHPDALRQGIATRLVWHVMDQAAAMKSVWISVDATHNAVRFYDALGFQQVGADVLALAPGIDFPFVRMVSWL